MEKSQKVIDVVIPCYNEDKCVGPVYDAIQEVFTQSLTEFGWNIIFIDDGSTDNTMQEIKKLAGSHENVFYISFARNFGKEAAIYAGLEKSRGDYVALMDADLQHPPKLLIEMTNTLETQDYDCVGARRISREGEPPIRSALSQSFYHVINWATGMHLVPGMTDYRLMKRSVADSIVALKEKERFIKGIYSWVGYKTKWIDYENVERIAGDSKWNIRGLWNYAKSGFIAFANTPLRGVIYIGMLVLLTALIYGISLLVQVQNGTREWTEGVTIIFLLLFLGGTIIATLGIIGEYLARIYMEVKNRPIYIARDTNMDEEDK